MLFSILTLVFVIMSLSARKLASYAPKTLQTMAYGFFVVVGLAGAAFGGWKWLQQMGPARFEPTLVNFLMLSFLLFVVGVAGVLTRRNIIIIFMSIELILNAVNLNLIAFSRYLELNKEALTAKGLAINPLSGPVFTIFIIVVAAAEAAVGLGIVIAMFRNRETVAIDEIDLLKW